MKKQIVETYEDCKWLDKEYPSYGYSCIHPQRAVEKIIKRDIDKDIYPIPDDCPLEDI